jgi:TLD
LFKPIFAILSGLFTKHKESVWKYHIPTLPGDLGTLLTVPRASQIGTFLSETLDIEELKLINRYTPATGVVKVANLMRPIQETQYAILLLFSGKTTLDQENHMYGMWIPSPHIDGNAIKCYKTENWERCAAFQLSPVHDVFYGNVGKLAWHVSTNVVWFGDETKGVAMNLVDSLNTLKVVHTASAASGQTYEAKRWRGDWVSVVEIDCIELWTPEYTMIS